MILKHKKKLVSTAAIAASVAVWLIIWQIAASRIDISFILPTPVAVFKEIAALIPQREFISTVAGSMLRVFAGYFLGITAGAVLAFLSHFFYPVKAFLSPVIKIITATPIASFILLCMLWMVNESISVFIGFLMVLPIVYGNVMTGLQNTDTDLKEAAKMYGFSSKAKLIYLYIPSALPYFAASCITSVGLAWKASVSAEIMCITAKSIGYHIYFSKQWMDTEKAFAYTVCVIVLSILCEYAVKGIAMLIKRSGIKRFGGAYEK